MFLLPPALYASSISRYACRHIMPFQQAPPTLGNQYEDDPVYELYELTPEEITIVESQTK
jgi:hypothetical protein